MAATRVLYHTLQRLLRASTPLVGGGTSKVARGISGRRGAAEGLVAWAGHTSPAGSRVWFHAPSVGEGLQARAVMEALQARVPTMTPLFTHFSPSAEGFARSIPAGWSGYLPWDVPEEMAPALDALAPDLLVFTKTEVWPTLVEEASARRVPVALVAGSVPPGAGRARWPARAFLRPAWAGLSLVAAVDEADARGFRILGAQPETIHVTGDPGVDSAVARVRGGDPDAPYLRPFRADPRPTLVAGSTWRSDMAVLVPAFLRLRRRVPDARLVVAPHEPSERVVSALVRAMTAQGCQARSLTQVEEDGVQGVDVVLVDRVGILARLYGLGRVAYVGGGFHRAGLHSVVEPAAAGVPVLFGPGHANARAAAALLTVGGGREAGGSEALAEALVSWFVDASAHDYAASAALGYIDGHLGAADRTAALLEPLLT